VVVDLEKDTFKRVLDLRYPFDVVEFSNPAAPPA
jgi:hypothetical protein